MIMLELMEHKQARKEDMMGRAMPLVTLAPTLPGLF